MKRLVVLLILLGCQSWVYADYRDNAEAKLFIADMQKQSLATEAQLQAWIGSASKQQSILDAIARPAEKTKTWAEYANIFLTKDRIEKGVEFWREQAETLARAEQTYGVPASIIVAIIGVETRYGRNMGSYRVIDALATLAFDYPPRAPFFRKELEHFIQLVQEQKQDPLVLKGSYAGAMGYGQFMPSSFRNFAVDFDSDGVADIWGNPVDAIGSVANYFVGHGWTRGAPVTVRVGLEENFNEALLNTTFKPDTTAADAIKAGFNPTFNFAPDEMLTLYKLDGKDGAEFWAGANNYYVITRYNHSRMYALAVYQLSQAIEQAYQK